MEGDFISRSIDDSGWWAIAWIDAYDYTHDARYLNEAVTIANYVQQYWDTSTCGGGVWWDREKTYKNAVTNGQYLWLTTALHQRIAGDTVWLQRAKTSAAWYKASGMINSSGLVNDGLSSSCANNGSTVWSYNQGLAIGGFTELWRTTGDSSLLATAKTLANAAISSSQLTVGGVLTESCDVGSASCDDNQKQFKGIFMRNFADLAERDRLQHLPRLHPETGRHAVGAGPVQPQRARRTLGRHQPEPGPTGVRRPVRSGR
ncbi:glycoside hydrolase family 76 protein [Streptomyces sp. L7]